MTYDFDTPVDRRGTFCEKWDIKENELPMWVADMDFKTAPEITNAVIKRAEHGIFGYTGVPDEWYDAYITHWRCRHNVTLKREGLVYSAGVVPTISSAVRKLTTAGENVVLMTPVYNIFYNSVQNNGRNVLESPLVYDGERYHIDFDDLESKLKMGQTTMLLLCNPQNPAGIIWSREELARIGELAYDNGVIIVCDEVHCDLTYPGKEYIPFVSVSEKCRQCSITCIAPTKAFNIAGIQTSAAYSENPVLRHKIWRAVNTDEVGEPNAFAINATIAAFSEGTAWLDALREYIYKNAAKVSDFLKAELPKVKLYPSEATYLLWLDVSEYGVPSKRLAAFIRKESGLFLSHGELYGGTGRDFLRMNIACPSAYVDDGLARLKRSLDKLDSQAFS
ncbi:MAG: pyridoxal phosphate-dependent aminotransferase [Ruminococcus sp.]|nr:pyridoxal phosphate-dependent aminotransferase [Ruminococcus sp.]